MAVAAAQAADEPQDSGHYFKFDVGLNYTGDLHQNFQNFPLERDIEMNLGVRGSLAEEFVLNRFLAIELEAAAIWNELDGSYDWLMQTPLLANLILRYECRGGWTAFVGVGGGGAGVIAKTSALEHDTDFTIVPAWQASAGLNYKFGNGMRLGLVYKYLGMSDPELELTIQGVTQRFKLEDIHNHYGGLQLIYSF